MEESAIRIEHETNARRATQCKYVMQARKLLFTEIEQKRVTVMSDQHFS
jgi:hypothetical protein